MGVPGVRWIGSGIAAAAALAASGAVASAAQFGPPVTLGTFKLGLSYGYAFPNGFAVDRAGDLFASDTSDNRVLELARGASNQTVTKLTGLSAPFGLAVDATGDLFVADSGNNRVAELAAGSTTTTTLLDVQAPLSLAVNSAGTQLFVDYGSGGDTDPFDDDLVEEYILSGAYDSTNASVFASLSPALGPENSLALDSSGDLLATDFNNNRVVEYSALENAFEDIAGPTGGDGLGSAIAVDPSGDVFVTDRQGTEVFEYAADGAGSAFPALPTQENGLASDVAGNLYVLEGNTVVEYPAILPVGAMTASASAAAPGSSIELTSVTPCPAATTTAVSLTLHSGSSVVATGTAILTDRSGDWAGSIAIPSTATDGADSIWADCTSKGLDLQNYAELPFTVGSSATGGVAAGTDGAAGPPGPAGAAGPTGSAGPAGPQGPAGASAEAPSSERSTCRSILAGATTTSTCIYTFTYRARQAAMLRSGARALATVQVNGKAMVVAAGRIRGRRLRLRFEHLRRGRYRVSLWELVRHRRVLIGHEVIVIR